MYVDYQIRSLYHIYIYTIQAGEGEGEGGGGDVISDVC